MYKVLVNLLLQKVLLHPNLGSIKQNWKNDVWVLNMLNTRGQRADI